MGFRWTVWDVNHVNAKKYEPFSTVIKLLLLYRIVVCLEQNCSCKRDSLITKIIQNSIRVKSHQCYTPLSTVIQYLEKTIDPSLHALYQTNMLSWICVVLAHRNNSHSQPVFALSPCYCGLSGEAITTNLIVFGLSRTQGSNP